MTRTLPLAALALSIAAPSAHTQRPASDTTARPSWDVTQPRGKTREIDFVTSEGTWISPDLSPDGTWIVFDLLGHIYKMPAAGGEATVLTQNSGVALNFQPRISPDGRTIAFISDRLAAGDLAMQIQPSTPNALATTEWRYR